MPKLRRKWRGSAVYFADDEDEIDGALVYELDNVRQRGLRLSDDGELVNVPFVDEDEAQESGAKR